MKRVLFTTGMSFSLLLTASAFAAEGYVTGNANLRAGPDATYPVVARLRAGTTVDIDGCVDGWSWCDVSTGDDRGWMPGNYLQEEYEGRRVLVPGYGVRIGIPILSFAFADYWGEHYRHRSWYGERERYSHVRPQYHSASIRTDAHANSYNHATYGAQSSGALHESRAPAYRRTDPSRQADIVPQRASRMTAQPATTRQGASMQGNNAHVQNVENNAGASTHHVATRTVAEAGTSPGAASRSVEHRVEQPRVVTAHKTEQPNASSRGMEAKSAHEPVHGKGNGDEKVNDKGGGKGNGKDKSEGQH